MWMVEGSGDLRLFECFWVSRSKWEGGGDKENRKCQLPIQIPIRFDEVCVQQSFYSLMGNPESTRAVHGTWIF